jgi:hypothetical protein
MPSPWDYAKDTDEHSHQVALFMWVAVAAQHGIAAAWERGSYAAPGWTGESKGIPELRLLFAIPNGGQRDIRVAAKLKAEGVKPGVHDLMLPVPRHGLHGLWIEMKKPGGTMSKEQKEWLKSMHEQGYGALMCDHWEKAAQTLTEWFS